MKKIWTAIRLLWRVFFLSIQILFFARRRKETSEYFRYINKTLSDQLYETIFYFKRVLQELKDNDRPQIGEHDPQLLKKMGQMSTDLHSLLPNQVQFSYAILTVIDHPERFEFKRLLSSLLSQSAPNLEIVLGFRQPLSDELAALLAKFELTCPRKITKINGDNLSNEQLLNKLARQASSNFLLLVEQDGWLRPDLLLRYEQTLRLLDHPDQSLIYSDESIITKMGHTKAATPFLQQLFHFPYCFATYVPGCMLISKQLWLKVNGIRPERSGAAFYDLLLRLDLAGASFHNIPFKLYSHTKDKFSDETSAILALTDYVKAKKLDWHIEKGYMPGTLRAVPALKKSYSIHVIIPYKDHKKLTLEAVKSLKQQHDVSITITAVDNNSTDHSIAQELRQLDVEVISITEPFNFSRLNNAAVKLSKTGQKCELLLFMNNDVALDPGALAEMCRWIDQPGIGMVGCRLNYPDGSLQSGGIDIDHSSLQTVWKVSDSKSSFEDLTLQRTLRVADGITGAAALIKKDIFLKVSGWDEIWYPITFSDVNLIMKVNALGLHCFYTPFAVGTHHESMSREIDYRLEEYETSTWLKDRFFARFQLKKSPLSDYF